LNAWPQRLAPAPGRGAKPGLVGGGATALGGVVPRALLKMAGRTPRARAVHAILELVQEMREARRRRLCARQSIGELHGIGEMGQHGPKHGEVVLGEIFAFPAATHGEGETGRRAWLAEEGGIEAVQRPDDVVVIVAAEKLIVRND